MFKGVFILYLINLGCFVYAQQPKFIIDGVAQGTSYGVQYYAPNSVVSEREIDSVLSVIDKSMSLYDNQSLITAFNKADQSIALDEHMSNVVRRSFEINRISKGIFDITVMPLVNLWGFGPNRVKEFPQPQIIDSILQFVGMDKLALNNNNTLTKKDKRVQVDLNGIAQGYSVDVVSQLLDSKGIENYLVELGGEIKVKGYKDVHVPFEIAIESPKNGKYSDVILQLTDRAVTTSGNYRRAFDVDGRRIHHHINPSDGYPVQNNVTSVTVIARTAMDADGYDNVFMAMTPEEGVNLANSLKDIEVYIIYEDNGQFKEAFSAGFHQYIRNN